MRIAAPAASHRNGILVSSLLSVLLVLINSRRVELATLKEVCQNRQVPIVSLAEARRLVGELAAKPEACMQNYRQSFRELNATLEIDAERLALCGENKFNQIKEFHFRYIQPPVETLGKVAGDEYKQRLLVPVALAQFFKAWALQVSGMCKRTLAANLDQATQLLAASDYELLEGKTLRASTEELREASSHLIIEEEEAGQDSEKAEAPREGNFFTRRFRKEARKSVESGPVAAHGQRKQFKYDLSFEKLVYMPELEGELEQGDTERVQATKVLDLRSKPELNKFMHACELRFKPIYSKLILPIVRLAKLGYEYTGPALDSIKKQLFSNPLLAKWMLVTMVCESQGRLELTGAPGADSPRPLPDYRPIYTFKLEGELWVKGGEALRLEVERTRKEHLTGFKKFLYKAGLTGRKAIEYVDPLQYRWYRKNHGLLMSLIIITSIMTGILSKTVKISG